MRPLQVLTNLFNDISQHMMGPTMPSEESMSDLEMDGSQSEAEEDEEESGDEAPQLVDMAEADLIEALRANQKKRKQSGSNSSAKGERPQPWRPGGNIRRLRR